MTAGLSPLERLRRSGVTPDRALGQNFLVDPNILDVIERMASLGGSDTVLEVGPGLGVLTGRLIERCGFVHAIEVDFRLAAVLEDEFRGLGNFQLYVADAMRFPLSELSPAPGKFVSNLPYSVAAPLIMKSLEELEPVRLWCLMLQKEIAGRLFAAPGSSGYGAISVMTQLMAEKMSSRAVSGSVFHPRPRVRSVLLSFRRRQGDSYAARNFAAVKALVRACFSHRRKYLANSLAGAEPEALPPPLAGLPAPDRKRLIEEMLARTGLPARVRPQQVTPLQYEELAVIMAEL